MIGFSQIACDWIRECTHCWKPFAPGARKIIFWPHMFCWDCYVDYVRHLGVTMENGIRVDTPRLTPRVSVPRGG